MTNTESDTEDLDGDLMELVTVHGRDFQRYSIDRRIYFGPVDDDEMERLELQQRIFNLVFDDRLIFPPISQPQKVLDCGFGCGAWAMEVAEQHPYCKVIGIDISPHMRPDDAPENLYLQVDDLNKSFTFQPNRFDLVHSRLVASGINRSRWPSYIRDLVRQVICNDKNSVSPSSVTKRGGWVQMIELYLNVQSDNGSITDQNALRQWSTKYKAALDDLKDMTIGTRLGNLMTAAGLVEVDTKMMQLPLSAWSSVTNLRQVGELNRQNSRRLLSSVALYPLTQRLHMSRQEFEALVDRAREEIDDLSLKAPGTLPSDGNPEVLVEDVLDSSRGVRYSNPRQFALGTEDVAPFLHFEPFRKI
ncbi:hypothetical protein Egran_01356 [Elaphomyces granulatus]|uniref:Methyltransferase domain-containing protein n=1 Tax=Elaphomyces granulatus TaxID=519963 RepID=A0A232M3A9_9EURO|nr:hypothetical protein Egran_01356 [Elaphomyces granulatus]